jgi:hypothetical protein
MIMRVFFKAGEFGHGPGSLGWGNLPNFPAAILHYEFHQACTPRRSTYIIIHHHTSSYIHTILIIHTIHIHIHIHMSYCHPYNPYPYKSPVSTSPAHPVLGTCSAQNLARRLNQLAAVRASARLCFFSAGILPQVKPVDGEGWEFDPNQRFLVGRELSCFGSI